MNPVTILNIMYAPLSYLHPERRVLQGIALDLCPASIANQLLIDHYRLETAIDFGPQFDCATRRCLEHWTRLPRICFLMGVQCLRAALIEQRRYHDLDPVAQRFMCLPLHADVSNAKRSPRADRAGVLSAGTACIGGLLERLPGALRQRVPLLYPKAIYPLRQHQHADDRDTTYSACWNPSLFSLALNYAFLDHPSVS